jgi:hypothetical protein
MEGNIVKATFVLNNGVQLTGFVNIIEHKRFSDFIELHPLNHIKLSNVTIEGNSSDSIANFVMIPKRNILYYKPLDEQSVKKIKL